MVHIMTTNKKFLKNILATASTLAIAMSGAIEAEAWAAVAIVADANTSTALTVGNAANNWANFTGNYTLTFDATGTIAGAFMGASGTINVANTATIGSIASGMTNGSRGTNLATINVTDGKTLTLSGATYGTAPGGGGAGSVVGANGWDYGGINSVTLGTTTTGAAATLNIMGSTGGTPTYYFAIDSIAGATNQGILNISDSVLFQTATIGGTTPLSAINITNNGTNIAGLTSAKATKINLISGASAVRL